MQPFKYTRAADPGVAVAAVIGSSGARFIAGGTNLLDLMKEGVTSPSELVDVTWLNLTQIRSTAAGISIGALAKNADTANHPLVRRDHPLLTQAILAGASAQIRNMATNGGNLLQRTRCSYFYDVSMPCNKREPGSGCGAMDGINRTHAVFGWSDKCVAVHPSDMAVALAALNATVNVQGKDGKSRVIPFADFHRLPGDNPEKDNTLDHGELITSIEIPKNLLNRSYYLKVRDRASYAFALISVAAAMETKGGIINGEPRIAMGGVAHKPWRASVAEKYLAGKKATEENFAAAADAEMKNARTLEHNRFKVELGKRAIVHALMRANGAI
ncbi:MAG: xanthine dehydrogenase family protein subunit M [Acidobacteriota bacterium]